MSTIDRDALLDYLAIMPIDIGYEDVESVVEYVKAMPTIEPERKQDIIQKFHDYQVEWLKAHNDIELEPELEGMIVRFLHDTANCYIMELGDDMRGEQE